MANYPGAVGWLMHSFGFYSLKLMMSIKTRSARYSLFSLICLSLVGAGARAASIDPAGTVGSVLSNEGKDPDSMLISPSVFP